MIKKMKQAGRQAFLAGKDRAPVLDEAWQAAVTEATSKQPAGAVGASIPLSVAWLDGWDRAWAEKAMRDIG